MIRKLLGGVVASALLFALPVPDAHADSYAPSGVDQDFSGSQGGWTQSSDYSGLCIQSLLCPAVYNSWAAGGADTNGYLRAQFSSLASTVAGTSTSTWESPAFTYDGFGGKIPGSVSFDMSMLRNLGALLDVSLLNDSSYAVDLVDQTSGNKVSVIPATSLAPNTTWQAVPTASVDPSLLAVGDAYTIRITTAYHAVATLVASGEVGYDDVSLTTSAATIPNPAPGPIPTPSPNPGPKPGGITDIRQLRKIVKNYILPTSARVDGRLLVVHLRCPATADPRPCQIQFAGLQKGKFSKAATARKIVKLKATKERTVKIRIKPAYVRSYATAKKIWTKIIVRVGRVHVTVRKTMKLKH